MWYLMQAIPIGIPGHELPPGISGGPGSLPPYPSQGLPGQPPYPSQGLPGQPPYPSQGLPGQPPYPSQDLPPGIWGGAGSLPPGVSGGPGSLPPGISGGPGSLPPWATQLPWGPPDQPGVTPHGQAVAGAPPATVDTATGAWVLVSIGGALVWAWAQKPQASGTPGTPDHTLPPGSPGAPSHPIATPPGSTKPVQPAQPKA
jgi:hypothetical protein